MHTVNRLVALLALVAAPRVLQGQEVRGQVTDRDTGDGISSGVVVLVDVADGRLVGHVAVGQQGQYAFRAPAAGSYVLQFVGPGYGPTGTSEFTLAAGETRVLALRATALPAAALDSVEVQGQRVPSRLQWFYQRRAEGPGEFFTREEIERLNPVVPTDILQPVRGISVVRAGPGVRLASRQDPAACGRTDRPAGPVVFLDGLLLGRGMALNLDGLLTANAIEAVEVYAGSGDVPPEFDRPGAECGAVSLWTRAVVPAPAPTPVFEAGGQFGTWISSGGLAEGRLGVRFVIGFTSWVEVNAAVNQIIEGLETGSAGLGRTGSQVIVAARGRPLGRESPFYLGVGATFLALRVSSSNVNDEDHAVVLAGAAARVGRVRPFVELQAVAPWGDAQLHAYTGVTVRLY